MFAASEPQPSLQATTVNPRKRPLVDTATASDGLILVLLSLSLSLSSSVLVCFNQYIRPTSYPKHVDEGLPISCLNVVCSKKITASFFLNSN